MAGEIVEKGAQAKSYQIVYTDGKLGGVWAFDDGKIIRILLALLNVIAIHVRLSDGSLVIVKRKGGGEG